MKMEIGDSYIVYINIDEDSYRIMASAKVEHFFNPEFPPQTWWGSGLADLAKNWFGIQSDYW